MVAWLEEEDSTDDKNEAAQNGSKMKKQDPTKGLSNNNVSKKLIFSIHGLLNASCMLGCILEIKRSWRKQ